MDARRLTHVELLHRPGERALAQRVFGLLGCRPVDRGGHFFSVMVDPDVTDWRNNILYASEATPEQCRFEDALTAALDEPGPLGDSARAYADHFRSRPQYSAHFGLRCATLGELEAIVARVAEAAESDPELAGRIEVRRVFRPEDPDAATDTMVQAFLHTDVVATGLLCLGQHIELQWHVPQ